MQLKVAIEGITQVRETGDLVMIWCLCRPASPTVQDEEGRFVATCRDVQTAESIIAMHNAVVRRIQTPDVSEDRNEGERAAEAVASGWTRKVGW